MVQCSDEEMQHLLGVLGASGSDAVGLNERLIETYPNDARLHFLRGSILVTAGRPIEAHAALSRAVELAPDFALARFQLGFFELTSGEAKRALATWEPLVNLPDKHYLRRFVSGLGHLIHDRFPEAATELRAGIEANDENAPLNRDMQLIIDECATQLTERLDPGADETSATSFFLDQLGARGTTH